MITKKYAVLALLGIGVALLSVPVMADAVKITWLGVDCSTLRAGMVPICYDLNILKDYHITPLEADVYDLETDVETLMEATQDEVPTIREVVVLVDSNDSICENSGVPKLGWCPDDRANMFKITDPNVTELSFIMISYKALVAEDVSNCIVNEVQDGYFGVKCDRSPEDGADLHYIIIQ